MTSISAAFPPALEPLASFAEPLASARTGKPHRVVVLGRGPGAQAVVNGLRNAPVGIVLFEQRKGGLVQPMMLDQPNATVLLGRVSQLDTARRCVRLDGAGVSDLPYDSLVVADSADESEAGEDAAGLIRQRMMLAFEYAESEPDPAERRRLLTFVVIGGGLVGVEVACCVAELRNQMLAEECRSVPAEEVRVILVEAGPRLLPGCSDAFASGRQAALEQLGVAVRLGAPVTEVATDHVSAGGEQIAARTAIWAAAADTFGARHCLRAHTGRDGRVDVTERLTLPNHADVYVIAQARPSWEAGRMRRAGSERREGAYVARAIQLALEGRKPSPFRASVTGWLAAPGLLPHPASLLPGLRWGAA